MSPGEQQIDWKHVKVSFSVFGLNSACAAHFLHLCHIVYARTNAIFLYFMLPFSLPDQVKQEAGPLVLELKF